MDCISAVMIPLPSKDFRNPSILSIFFIIVEIFS